MATAMTAMSTAAMTRTAHRLVRDGGTRGTRVAALTQAQNTMSTVSQAITATAANYDAVEQGNTGRFSGGVQ